MCQTQTACEVPMRDRRSKAVFILPTVELLTVLQQYESLLQLFSCSAKDLVEMVVKHWLRKNAGLPDGRTVEFLKPFSAEEYVLDLILVDDQWRSGPAPYDAKDIQDVVKVTSEITDETAQHFRLMLERLDLRAREGQDMNFIRWLGDDIVIEKIGTF